MQQYLPPDTLAFHKDNRIIFHGCDDFLHKVAKSQLTNKHENSRSD